MICVASDNDAGTSLVGVTTLFPSNTGDKPVLRIFCGAAMIDLTDQGAVEHFFREVYNARDEYRQLTVAKDGNNGKE